MEELRSRGHLAASKKVRHELMLRGPSCAVVRGSHAPRRCRRRALLLRGWSVWQAPPTLRCWWSSTVRPTLWLATPSSRRAQRAVTPQSCLLTPQLQALLGAVAASALKLDFAALQPRCACSLRLLAAMSCRLRRCCLQWCKCCGHFTSGCDAGLQSLRHGTLQSTYKCLQLCRDSHWSKAAPLRRLSQRLQLKCEKT